VALGVDLERSDGQPLAHVSGIAGPPDVDPALRMLLDFSAKEAVFKAQFPLTFRRLGFEDLSLSWLPRDDEFGHRAVVTAGCPPIHVSCLLSGTWVVSAALMTAHSRS
jgi:4'-phosphopantetheinyl transferase EntD